MSYLQTIVLCVTIGTVMSHLCLISPRQRGTMDISKGGSRTCTRHVEPCGGENIESPQVEYKPGESVFIKWQQNFNHYEPGYPGYMDIGIATSPNSTDFTTLAVVTDKYVHAQDYQENYTAIVKLPDVPCDHCVIRARYNAHKPGETPFLQCADIKITSSPSESTLKYISSKQQSVTDKRQLLPLKRALKLRQKYKSTQKQQSSIAKLYGFAYNPFEPQRSHYVSIETGSGKIDPIQSYTFGIDTPTGDQKTFLVDEVISIDYGRNTSNVLIHKSTGRESAASNLYIVGTMNGSLVQSSDIFKFTGAAINALSWYTYGTSAALRITPADPGFPNVVGAIDGTFVKILTPSVNEPDYLCRKGFHALNIMMACDADFRITSCIAKWPGSVHDSRVFKDSSLCRKFETGQYKGILLGDSAYSCKQYCLTPFINPNSPMQVNFNKAHCRTRVVIEQTFGILKRRFACLHYGLRVDPVMATKIIVACAVLHNFGILRGDILFNDDNDFDDREPDDLTDRLDYEDGRSMRNTIARNFFS